MSSTSPTFKVFYAISMAWQLGFLIVFPVLGFGLIGGFIDTHTNSLHIFATVGFVVGVGVAAYETFNMLKPFIVNKHKKYF